MVLLHPSTPYIKYFSPVSVLKPVYNRSCFQPEEGHDEMKKGSHESPQLLDKSELETKNQEIELLRKTLQGTQMVQ
jgi:hypothetical protein